MNSQAGSVFRPGGSFQNGKEAVGPNTARTSAEYKGNLLRASVARNGAPLAYVQYACIPMTIKANGRVRGKGLTRHLAGSFPPASEKKLGWMTPPV